MKNLIPLTAFAALAASGLSSAQTAYSKPSGYVTLGNQDSDPNTPDVPANTEVAISICLDRETEFAGAITEISGSQLTLNGASFTGSQFANASTPYQLLVTSGAEIGLRALISANGASTVTLGAVVVGDLSNVQAGDKVAISKTWTLGSFFPKSFPAGTRVLAFSGTTPGENIAPNLQFVWNGSTSWIGLVGVTPGSDVTNTILYQGESFIVQTGANPIASFVVTGAVPTTPSRTLISKLASRSQDNRISLTSPIDEAIGEMNLGFTPGDRLLAYNNRATGKNKAPNEVLVWNGTSWIGLVGFTPGSNQDLYKLKAGVGYVYKRISSAASGDVTWTATQSYLDDLNQ